MFKTFKTEIAGRPLVVETGKMAQLANGACLIKYGDTVVLSTVTASKEPRDGIDFFPLSVDYEEKLYSVGKIPGGFIKREGKPSEKAILASRAIDRPLRPLFPGDLRNDVVIINTVLSVEQDNSPEITAMLGASIALAISDVPFNGPIAGVNIGLVGGETIINPNTDEREHSDMNVTLAGTKDKICMIEASANEVPDDLMLKAIIKGHGTIKKICEFIDEIVAEVGKEKFEYSSSKVPEEIIFAVRASAYEGMRDAVLAVDKRDRDDKLSLLTGKVFEDLEGKFENASSLIKEAINVVEEEVVREYLKKEHKRVDGRSLEEIRPLAAEVALLPRTHGSGLFSRGQTQVLTVATLGPMSEIQMLDGIDLEEEKRYMHHYNFPSYSVGEARTSRGPGRREIGHGALAEKALEPVLPSVEDFPYAIRLVSEILMSNGSTSQASVCASTLALMDAGVPIKRPVAGISAGLIVNEKDDTDFITFMDIQGIEDFFGDMDFKVAGTKEGITAIQVDIKVQGLTYEVIRQAFELTRRGRVQILDGVMHDCLAEPRAEVSKYAPKVYTIKIDPDNIRDVIGSGGKVINKIIEETGVKIDIEDDGTIYVATPDADRAQKAIKIINAIVGDVEIGSQYEGKVVSVKDFGAFVEFIPGKQGLVHISKLANKRVARTEDIVTVGDTVRVKVIGVDREGKISLSMKDAD